MLFTIFANLLISSVLIISSLKFKPDFFITSIIISSLVWVFSFIYYKRLKILKGTNLFLSTLGLIMGYLIARFILSILSPLTDQADPDLFPYLSIAFYIFIMYLVSFTFYCKSHDLKFAMPVKDGKGKQEGKEENYKVLDTSVIIDGRIADISETGFLEGILIIPRFILNELQQIADSSDGLKRQRGRRGLDILNKMKKGVKSIVQFVEDDFSDIKEVDEKLIYLAKKFNGMIITNDFNLNKVAQIHGIQVLNINELANAVKPIVLPGEQMEIQVIKEGKDSNQGVGYLEDGTMVVVENGHHYIGKKIDVVVTSILQTTAGRMIFAK
ncbi:MAG: TRAM domain-containing protein [bacterium]|nr:TRAM domain-containing protein [bacterium]